MTPAADALPTNLFPTPETFGDYSVYELMLAASHGRIGVDGRLMKAVMGREDRESIAADLAKFAAEAAEKPLDLRLDLVQMFRRLKSPEAVPLFIALIREYGEDHPDELIEVVAEFGQAMVEPLLELYKELGEEQGGAVAFLLSGLQVRDPRILELLLEEFEYDTWEGALHLGLYGDAAAVPVLRGRLKEPGLDEEMQGHLKEAIREIETAREPFEAGELPDMAEYFDPAAPPEFDALPLEDIAQLLGSKSAEYRAATLEAMDPDDAEDPEIQPRLLQMARQDPDPNVRGRAWESLSPLLQDDPKILAEVKTALNDEGRAVEERVGALVALATATDGSPELNKRLKELYEVESQRKHVLKAMWRSMNQAFGSYMQFNLDHEDPEVVEQAIMGAGHLGLSGECGKLEKFMADDRFRSPALFNYSLIVPGPKDRMGVKAMLKKIEKVAKGLDSEETEIVKSGLDRRLMMRGMKPVFHQEEEHEHRH